MFKYRHCIQIFRKTDGKLKEIQYFIKQFIYRFKICHIILLLKTKLLSSNILVSSFK